MADSNFRQPCSVEQIGWPPAGDPSPPIHPNPPRSVHDLDLGWEYLWIRGGQPGEPDSKEWVYINYLDPYHDLIYGCIHDGKKYQFVTIRRSRISMHVPGPGQPDTDWFGGQHQQPWSHHPDFPQQHGFPQQPGFPGEKQCHVRVIGYPPSSVPSPPIIPNPPASVLELRGGWKYLWLNSRQPGQSGPEGWIYLTYLDSHFDTVIGCIYTGGNHYRRVWIPRRSIYSYVPF